MIIANVARVYSRIAHVLNLYVYFLPHRAKVSDRTLRYYMVPLQSTSSNKQENHCKSCPKNNKQKRDHGLDLSRLTRQEGIDNTKKIMYSNNMLLPM